MSNKETKYIRKGNKVTDLTTGKVEKFPSIGAAKRFSRHIQITQDGGLGRGSVKVQK